MVLEQKKEVTVAIDAALVRQRCPVRCLQILLKLHFLSGRCGA